MVDDLKKFEDGFEKNFPELYKFENDFPELNKKVGTDYDKEMIPIHCVRIKDVQATCLDKGKVKEVIEALWKTTDTFPNEKGIECHFNKRQMLNGLVKELKL